MAAQSVDTLIIGCGMAGMAAAIRLAMFGRDVLLLEKHNAPGGLNSFYFRDGRKFDVGLHAVTNYVPEGVRGTPLIKLLRQLRISRADLQLSPQCGSRIAFPSLSLRFNNEFELLESQVASQFPREIDGFRALRKAVREFNALDLDRPTESARRVVRAFIKDPLLEDMLFCPLMYYGSARERDMDFDQFVTLWQAIYEEGFARPYQGVRVIIRALSARYKELGGKRRMKAAVRRILQEGGTATGVELEDGQVILAKRIISTAGWPETLRLCEPERPLADFYAQAGRLSFCETISVLRDQPADWGMADTIVFFNHGDRFEYRVPEAAVDLASGVLCCPNNYQYDAGKQLDRGYLRVTVLANPAIWNSMDADLYASEKAAWFSEIVATALQSVPTMDAAALTSLTEYTDMFTPRTIERFTGHFRGAVYGAPVKSRRGLTHLKGLYLAGTDQGFLGIIGAMLSGISMANAHVLQNHD